MVFQNLSDEYVEKKYNEYIAQGMSEDDAFTEIYSEECNQDGED